MKRRMALVAVILFVVCAMAFARPGEEKPPAGQAAPPAAAPAKVTVEPYTLPIAKTLIELRYLCRDTGEAGKSFTKNKSVVWEEIEKKTNIRIKWDVAPEADYATVFNLRMASKSDLPDLVEVVGSTDGAHLGKFASEKILLPISGLIDRYCPNLLALFKDFPEYRAALTLPDGEMYSLGLMNATKNRSRGILIRRDWLDNLGLKMPTTAEEFTQVALAFKQRDPNKNGKNDEIPYVPQSQWKQYLRAGVPYGLNLVVTDGWSLRNGKVEYDFAKPAFKDYLAMMNTFYVNEVIPKDWTTADTNMCTSRIANNLVGLTDHYIDTFMGYSDPGNTINKTNPPEIKWEPIKFKETAKYGKATYDMEAVAVRWRTWAITTVNKYPVESIRLFDYMLGDPYGRRINMMGPEGLIWALDEKGNIYYPPNWPERMPQGAFLGNAWFPYAHIFGIEDQMGPYIKDNPERKKWALDIWNSMLEVIVAPNMPPIPSVEDGAKITKLYADLLTYRDEMVMKFILGTEPLSNFDQYVKTMGNLGLTEITSLYQKYYDATHKK